MYLDFLLLFVIKFILDLLSNKRINILGFLFIKVF